MRIFLTLFLCMSAYLFCNTYNYDKQYEKELKENAVKISEEQKKAVRENIVKWTEHYLSKGYKYREKVLLTHPVTKEEKYFIFDCSGFVAAVYWSANIVVFDKQAVFGEGGVKTIYATLDKYNKLYKNGFAGKGDIVIFDRTTSSTAKLTHTGIVINVDSNSTVTFVHSSVSKGLTVGYMNLKYSNENKRNGNTVNSYLKNGAGINGLASKCFNTFATILDIP